MSGGESRPQQLHFVVKVGVGAISVGVAASRQCAYVSFVRSHRCRRPRSMVECRVGHLLRYPADQSRPARPERLLARSRHTLKGCRRTARGLPARCGTS